MSNLSELLPAGAGAKSAEFVASGTLGSGVTVALNSDGTVSVIQETLIAQSKTSPFQGTINPVEIHGSAYASNLNLIVVSYRDGSTSYPTTVAGSISGSTITFGTPYVINSYSGEAVRVAYYPATPYFWYTYRNTGNQIMDRYLSISGTTFSQWGGVYGAIGQQTGDSNIFIMDQASCHLTYSDTSTSTGLVRHGYVGFRRTNWISGLVTFSSTQIRGVSSAQNDSSSQYVITYSEPVNSNRGMAVVGTMTNPSGPSQTLSFGAPQTFTSDDAYYPEIGYSSADDKYVIVYTNNSNSSYGYAVVATVSGSSISFGTPVVIKSSASYGFSITYDSDLNEMVIVFRDNPANLRTKLVRATISGTSLTFSSFFDITTFYAPYTTIQYSSVDRKTIISHRNSTNNNDRLESLLHQSPYSTTNNTDFIGITDQAIADTATGEVIVQGGVITNTNLNVATAITAGSKVVFDDGGPTTGIALAYDPDTAKVVNVFCTTNVRGIVGTVSGTSISYGSASSANGNSSSEAQVAYDTVNNKIVVVYKEGFNDARVVIGTVSGTAISWGTPVVFASVNAATPNVAFDTNAGKVLIVYKDQADNNYGKAVVGTVSGTSISIGSPVTFMNANANKIELVYDANAQKSVLVVQDTSNNIGVAYVATISGTSVSFGSPTNFLSSALAANALAITYNSTDNKVIVGFSKGSNNKGYLTTGTVSGTSISFAGETEFSGSTTTNYISLSYKASGNVLGMAYNIGGATTVKFNAAVISGTSFSFGTEQELTAGATDITAITVDLASGNFVASYGDGSNNYDGTTNVISVATTPVTGTDYYVQADGTLSTTISSVPAGRALSSTSILMEG